MLTDENAEQVLSKLKEVVQRKANVKQDEKTKAVSKLREVFTDTQHALDMARTDSVQNAKNLPDGKMKEVFGEARLWLRSRIMRISGLDKISYADSEFHELTNNFLQHW